MVVGSAETSLSYVYNASHYSERLFKMCQGHNAAHSCAHGRYRIKEIFCTKKSNGRPNETDIKIRINKFYRSVKASALSEGMTLLEV